MTKVLLIGDTSDRANWGCRATSQALKSLIAERAEISAVVDTKIWPAVFDLETTDHGAWLPFGSRYAFTQDRRLDEEALALLKKRHSSKGTCLARTWMPTRNFSASITTAA